MPIPLGTRQALGLRAVAERFGIPHSTIKRWWQQGRLVGRVTDGPGLGRVVVPVEVADFFLRYFRLPTKLDLLAMGVLSKEFLLELDGPDGGLLDERSDACVDATGDGLAAAAPS